MTWRRRRSAWRPAAAKSSMAQLPCRAAPGSFTAPTRRAPFSRCWTGASAKPPDILFRAHRAIPRTNGLPRVSVSENSRLFAIAGRIIDIWQPYPAGAARSSVGSPRSSAAADRKLTDRALDVKFDPGHFREQIDVRDPDRTSAEPHVGGHEVECLNQYADVLQNERIGNRAVLP